MFRAEGDIYLGQDFARTRDLSVQAVIEKIGTLERTIGVLAMRKHAHARAARAAQPGRAMPKFKKG
jgi:phage FluMu gp28-like protein